MSYQPPQEVRSPKNLVGDVQVICDTGSAGWSVAKVVWDGREQIGVRWNGGDDKRWSSVGNPQSRGLPTWFILPQALGIKVLEAADEISRGAELKLRQAYQEMAADEAAEAEALEWSEALIGDVADETR